MEAARTAVVEKPPSLDGLLALAATDMAAVDALIRRHMDSPVPVIPALADHLIAAGGKRLRPLLSVAAARLARIYRPPPPYVSSSWCLLHPHHL